MASSGSGVVVNRETDLQMNIRINKGSELTWTEVDENFNLLEQSLKLSAGFNGNDYYGYLASIALKSIIGISSTINISEDMDSIRQILINGTDVPVPYIIAKKGNIDTLSEFTTYSYNAQNVPRYSYIVTDINYNLLEKFSENETKEAFIVPEEEFYVVAILSEFDTSN